MTKINVTNKSLLEYNDEIDSWENKSGASILRFFLQGKVKEFRNKNEVRIGAVQQRLRDLGKEHYLWEMKDGKIEFQFEGEGKERKILYNENSSEEIFNEAYKAVMSELTVMEI